MRVCVIDDWSAVADMVRKYMPDCEVEGIYRLPEDETSLAEYDVLIVDGEGIGNSKYNHGVEFCKAYEKQGNNKKVIFFSGLEPEKSDRPILEAKGVAWFTKCCDPQILADFVTSLRQPTKERT